MGDGGMIHINLLKPGIELYDNPESRKEGEDWVIDLGIVHFELKMPKKFRMAYCKLKDKK